MSHLTFLKLGGSAITDKTATSNPVVAGACGLGLRLGGERKDRFTYDEIVPKLRENGWNISKTAEVIDTPRSNLYKKLEQYQISQETDG